ncbi:MAG: type III pantothenate kinase [Bacteroidota bacterium]
MNLIIDIGNTKAKLAVYKADDLLSDCVVDYEEVIDKIIELRNDYEFSKSIVSNVGTDIEGLNEFLDDNFFNIVLDSKTELPIKINYSAPETLGVDRRALAVAAYEANPEGNSLVVDMGSCITYDVVTADGVYQGGAISPGMNMRFKAMHNFTESLPLVSFKESHSIIGKDTEMSLVNGVVFGICSEIDNYIEVLKSEFENISVFISGGDHPFFANKLKNSIFADQKILLRGLNIILNYNFKIR